MLFDRDYLNKFLAATWDDNYKVDPEKIERYEYAFQLTDRKWKEEDFKNPELVGQGIKFGKDMWEICVDFYDKVKKEYPQPEKVDELGRKLIAYYSSIILGSNHH